MKSYRFTSVLLACLLFSVLLKENYAQSNSNTTAVIIGSVLPVMLLILICIPVTVCCCVYFLKDKISEIRRRPRQRPLVVSTSNGWAEHFERMARLQNELDDSEARRTERGFRTQRDTNQTHHSNYDGRAHHSEFHPTTDSGLHSVESQRMTTEAHTHTHTQSSNELLLPDSDLQTLPPPSYDNALEYPGYSRSEQQQPPALADSEHSKHRATENRLEHHQDAANADGRVAPSPSVADNEHSKHRATENRLEHHQDAANADDRVAPSDSEHSEHRATDNTLDVGEHYQDAANADGRVAPSPSLDVGEHHQDSADAAGRVALHGDEANDRVTLEIENSVSMDGSDLPPPYSVAVGAEGAVQFTDN